MVIVKITKEIIGDQLADELGIAKNLIYADGTGNLIIESDKSEKTILDAINAHQPKTMINHRANALAKLAALGLTEDEIAAL